MENQEKAEPRDSARLPPINTTISHVPPCGSLSLLLHWTIPARLPMPFSICPHRRFPVCCPVTYHGGCVKVAGWSGTCQRTGGDSMAICRLTTCKPFNSETP